MNESQTPSFCRVPNLTPSIATSFKPAKTLAHWVGENLRQRRSGTELAQTIRGANLGATSRLRILDRLAASSGPPLRCRNTCRPQLMIMSFETQSYFSGATRRVGYVLHPLIEEQLRAFQPKIVSEAMRRIFSDLHRFLQYLEHIEKDLISGRSLNEILFLFTLVHDESTDLCNYIDKSAMLLPEISECLFDALDGTRYVIGHELRRIFQQEMKGLQALECQSTQAKLRYSHGVLSNCFQQSTLALARVLEPSLDASLLCEDYQRRREQSLILFRHLWIVLQHVRQTAKDHSYLGFLIERVESFRNGSMRFLMYKDWESYERFSNAITEAANKCDLTTALEGFDCYLETLLGHVRMRAVLADSQTLTQEIENAFEKAA